MEEVAPTVESETTPLLSSPRGGPDKEDDEVHVCCVRLSARQASVAKTVLGYLLVVNAGLLFTLASVIQKIVAPELVFWHLLIYRALAQIVVMFADLQLRNVDARGPPGKRLRIACQGLMGGLLLLCIFVAITHIPLGSASAIFFCTPVFTFVFAVTMLGERLGAYRLLISALMVSGVVLITRPPFIFSPAVIPQHHHLHHHNTTADLNGSGISDHQEAEVEHFSAVGYLCAVAVPLLSAVVSIMTRQLRELRPSIIMFWFGIGSLVVSLVGIIAFRAGGYFDYTPKQIFYIVAITGLGMIGNISYTFAVRWVSPSKGNVFRSFEVILNYVLQLELEADSVFHPSSVVGICVLLCAVTLTGFENEAMQRFSSRFRFL